jgi:hypothetical protein
VQLWCSLRMCVHSSCLSVVCLQPKKIEIKNPQKGLRLALVPSFALDLT